jgi:lysozyme
MVRAAWLWWIVFIGFACEADHERRVDYAVQGIDVSHYQAHIDWEEVAADDFHFAFVKATEGMTHVDARFCYNWSEISRLGMRRGAYHFYRPSVPATEQAWHFINWVDLHTGDLPPVLDVEVLDGVPTPILLNELRTWLSIVERHYGIKPIIYTSLTFFNRHLAGHFDEYPLWIARYAGREPTLACGSDWHFWQYANKGRCRGVEGFVDLNVFFGTHEELEAVSLPDRSVYSIFGEEINW